ncbi:aspartyl protease [Anaerobacterium chartisolvens]|uniref:Aspartyl protease n=1 Tax=Anaerobacterium chartisolvens TaxID=1297424 RepID=A0A369B7V9_9FIRM|nr:aspartyl protease family protein [Anaerobacterium chartisolvens]RCX17511.1 aspartyl protease [Anaerobacterium chartisolvens]
MKLELRGGLLFTSLKLNYLGQEKVINNIVLDTGAVETLISPDTVLDIGIEAINSDSVNSYYGIGGDLHSFFSKAVDYVEIGNIKLDGIKLDFGVIDPHGDINGLLGLDILLKLDAQIDLKELTVSFKG